MVLKGRNEDEESSKRDGASSSQGGVGEGAGVDDHAVDARWM